MTPLQSAARARFLAARTWEVALLAGEAMEAAGLTSEWQIRPLGGGRVDVALGAPERWGEPRPAATTRPAPPPTRRVVPVSTVAPPAPPKPAPPAWPPPSVFSS